MARARKLSKTAAKIYELNLMGAEPTFKGNVIATQGQMINALNWYSQMGDYDKSISYLTEWVKTNAPSRLPVLTHISDVHVLNSMATIARLHTRGIILPKATFDKFCVWLRDLQMPAANENKRIRLVSSYDKVNDYIADIESSIDKLDPEFSAYGWLVGQSIAQHHAARIMSYYAPLAQELLAVYKKTDSELIEAYKSLPKGHVEAQLHYVLKIITDCNRYVGNVKKQRKPRKAKAKNPAVKFKHFKAAEGNDELKIKSINPQAIIGASKLFVLNTSNNQLTIFTAKEGGLDIQRSMITNYADIATKRVGKKIKAVIEAVLNGNKKQQNSVLDLVSSELIAGSDRINTHSVLLKATK